MNEEAANENMALAVPEETTLSLGRVVYTDVPNLKPEEMQFPQLRLAQGLTQEVAARQAQIGDWLITGYPPMQSPTIVPLKSGTRRARWVGAGDNRSVACWSPDAIQGHGDPGILCQDCPFAQWTPPTPEEVKKAGTAKVPNHKPECLLIHSFLVYVVEAETPAVLEFKATAAPAASFIKTLGVTRRFGNFAVKLDAVQSKNGAGNFMVPRPTLTTVDPEVLEMAQALFGIV